MRSYSDKLLAVLKVNVAVKAAISKALLFSYFVNMMPIVPRRLAIIDRATCLPLGISHKRQQETETQLAMDISLPGSFINLIWLQLSDHRPSTFMALLGRPMSRFQIKRCVYKRNM